MQSVPSFQLYVGSFRSSGLQGKLHHLLNYLTAPLPTHTHALPPWKLFNLFCLMRTCRKLPPMTSGLLHLELSRTLNNAFLLFANHLIQDLFGLASAFLRQDYHPTFQANHCNTHDSVLVSLGTRGTLSWALICFIKHFKCNYMQKLFSLCNLKVSGINQ